VPPTVTWPATVRTRARGPLLLGLLTCGVTSPGATQGSQPLRKTDVIRLLSNPLISKAEVADLIRRNCIAFRPTPRDWVDLRDFGADTGVLTSISGCATAAGAPRPGGEPPPLSGVLLTERVIVTAGAQVVTRVQLKRGDIPQAGIPLVLRGSSRIPGGPAQDVRATTGAGGIALFQFAVGRTPGAYLLDIVTASGFVIPGAPPLEVIVSPAGPADVDVQPARVEVRAGERGPISLLVTVRDSSGHVVPGEPVALQADGPDMGVAVDGRTTDSLGRVVFAVERSTIRRAGKLAIRVRGQVFGSVDVVRGDVAATGATGFVSGVGQHGIARTGLSEPLVFQVRSSTGRALAGKVVRFRGVNAVVAPDSVVTDAAGFARVEVTLGKQAGPALVNAVVDSIQKQAALSVEPAGPESVVIERDGMRVDGGRMAVTAGGTFVVRISALDAYGNKVPTTNLAHVIQETRTRFNVKSQLLKLISVESDGGAALVTFRAAGVGDVELSIAGAMVSVQVVPAP